MADITQLRPGQTVSDAGLVGRRKEIQDDCVRALKEMLARAEAGELAALAIIAISLNHKSSTWTSANDCHHTLIGAMYLALHDATKDGFQDRS